MEVERNKTTGFEQINITEVDHTAMCKVRRNDGTEFLQENATKVEIARVARLAAQ